MSEKLSEVTKSKVLQSYIANKAAVSLQVFAGLIMAIPCAIFIYNYVSPMKTSIWKDSAYMAEKNLKVLFLILAIITFALSVIMLIKVPALNKSSLFVTSKGVYGVAGKNYYFSTIPYTIPFDRITNVYAQGNGIYLYDGAVSYRICIDNPENAVSIIKKYMETPPAENEDNMNSKEKSASERVVGENEWRCPNCGQINKNYIGTCGCGERKK